jgi:hypothetical protein
MPQVRSREVVLGRIEALKRQADATRSQIQAPHLEAKASEVIETLREARSWLEASPQTQPELLVHVARMVDGASNRLFALVRSMS